MPKEPRKPQQRPSFGWRVLGAIASRSGLAAKLGQTFGGDRDLYETLGYRQSPTVDDYLSYYLRGDVAAKIVDLPAKTSWRHAPEIRSDDQRFVDAVAALDSRLRLFHYLQRIDRISGIGQFGVLLLGLRDGTDLKAEPGLVGEEGLLYMAPYHQGSVSVETWVEQTDDPRYGLPLTYKINLAGTTLETEGKKSKEVQVHWKRVLHVAEDTLEDDVYGTPRLQKVLNRIDDLNKVLGSSAEVFWQNAAGVWHADIDPEVAVSPEDMEDFEEDMLAARHGLQRLLQTRGVSLDTVAGAVADPKGAYEAIRQVIAAAAEIPERILFGSERGELASSQDQGEWHGRIASRQEQHVEPTVLRAALQRFAELGVLKVPDSYDVKWPPLDAPTDEERADTAQKVADAVSKVAPPGAADLVVPPWEFREEVLGLPALPPGPPEGWDPLMGTDVDETEIEGV